MKRIKPFLVVIAALLTLSLSGVATALFNDLLGLRFLVLGRAATGDIAIVAIDAPSIASEGIWPWPRSLHARLVDRLTEAGASDIAFDVDFSAASSPAEDKAFEDALKRAGGSVALPTFVQYSSSIGHEKAFVSQPLPRFANHSWSAAVNVRPDPDGKIRRYAIGQMLPGGVAPSIAVFIAGRSSIDETSFLIDYGIRSQGIPIHSFSDVLTRQELRAQLKGKKVIVGATAVELGDRVTIPGGRVMPGVMLQALAAESLLQGRDLQAVHPSIPLSVAVFFICVVALLHQRLPLRTVVAILIVFPVVCEGSAYFLQAMTPNVLDTVPLHLSALVWAAVIGASEFNFRDLLRRIAERRFYQVSMSIGDGLICTDAQGNVTLWNQAAERMFGYSSNDAIGRRVSDIIQTLDRKPWFCSSSDSNNVSDAAAPSRELLGHRQDGTEFLIEATVSSWDADNGQNYSIAIRDISIRKRDEEQIRYLAEHDPLTGLLNRRSFIQNLEARVVVALRSNAEVALLLIDVDRFKEINDTFGHAEGDHVLHKAAQAIQKAVGPEVAVARLGGDEFAVAVSASDASISASRIASKIMDALADDDLTRNSIQTLHVSIGAAIYPRHSDSAEDVMADADLAMYQAKSTEGSSFRLFDKGMRDAFESRLVLAEELKAALADGQFELHYQPQIDLRRNEIVGAEALIRWRHPTRGLIAPGHFIGLLNTLAISNDVSVWTLRTACRQAREWQLKGCNIRMGVNLSPAQLQTMDLPALTAQILHETGLPASLLELEVTEEIVIEDDVAAKRTFDRLHALGVHLAWDDFGTGYGSLIYLKKFALDRLKIDQSFVKELREGTQDYAIVEYTIRLCKVLGLSITAEGIESADVLPLLSRLGCDEGQGYHFSRPIPAAEFEAQLINARARNAA